MQPSASISRIYHYQHGKGINRNVSEIWIGAAALERTSTGASSRREPGSAATSRPRVTARCAWEWRHRLCIPTRGENPVLTGSVFRFTAPYSVLPDPVLPNRIPFSSKNRKWFCVLPDRFVRSRFSSRKNRFVPVLVPIFYIHSFWPTAHSLCRPKVTEARHWELQHIVVGYIASPLPHSPLPSRGGTKLMLLLPMSLWLSPKWAWWCTCCRACHMEACHIKQQSKPSGRQDTRF